MATSIFKDRDNKPNKERLSKVLGKTSEVWQTIKSELTSEHGELIEDWKYYNKKSGWILKALRKKRNLFFFVPLKDYFTISFVFGDKAVNAAERSDLPENIKQTLKNARKYIEGRGLQIDVKSMDDIEIIKKLVKIKISN